MFYPVSGNGYITIYDHPIHLYKCHFLVEHLIPEQKWIDGWCSWDYGGFPIFLIHPSLIYYLIAFLHYLSGIPVVICYKIVFIFLYAFTGWTVYYYFKDKISRRYAFLCSIIFMLYPRLYFLHIVATIAFVLSISLFILFFDSIEKFHKNLNTASYIKAILLFSAMIFTHIFSISAACALLFSSVFVKFICKENWKEVLWKYVLIVLIAIMFNFYYLWNVINIQLVNKSFISMAVKTRVLNPPISKFIWVVLGTEIYWNNNDGIFINIINNTPFILYLLLYLLGIAGIILYMLNLKRKKEGQDLFQLVLISFSLLILLFYILGYLPENYQILFFKHVYLLDRYMVFFLFVIICFFTYLLSNMKNNIPWRRFFYVTFIILAFLELFRSVYFVKDNLAMFDISQDSKAIEEVWHWVNKNVNKDEGRVVYQETYYCFPIDHPLNKSHVMTLSAMKTGVPQFINTSASEDVNFFLRYFLMLNHFIFGRPIDEISDTKLYNLMRIFNAHYIVSCEEELKSKLEGSSLFILKFSSPPFTIFEIKDKEKISWTEFSYNEIEYNILKWTDSNIVLKINNSFTDNQMLLKVLWHPYWKAYIDGNEISIGRNQFGMIMVDLPDKKDMTFELRYSSFNPVTVTVNLLSFLVFFIYLVVLFYRKLSTAPGKRVSKKL